jgi:ubiquinone biosynthesis monooxygenase Coq7
MERARPFLDQILISADRALRAVLAPAAAGRPTPGSPAEVANDTERRHAAGLMRVNHAGEIAAQGLYHGQALVARNPTNRALLEQAAREETDHLAWCEQRLGELHDRPSRLDPLWYAGSFAIGALAGLAGDRISLGFVSETERQVERHLDGHLAQPRIRCAQPGHPRADARRRDHPWQAGARTWRRRAAAPGPADHERHGAGHDHHCKVGLVHAFALHLRPVRPASRGQWLPARSVM